MELPKTLPPQPLPNMQIVINETQVSLQEPPASSQGGPFSNYTTYMNEDTKSNGSLTFTSNTLINDVVWKVFIPPQELIKGNISMSDKYGIQELDAELKASITRAKLRAEKHLKFSRKSFEKLPFKQTNSAGEDSSIKQPKETRLISQESTQTNKSSDSEYISPVERYHSNSDSIFQPGYSKLSAFARFKKLFDKKEKRKSV
ncbi:hypothetical protein DSL72_002979 [Monilinia vaccinii-corymbosi]|uniref:Uncharacterized protein n=1 Tax=Monilinia vaccinii-corymbosi TaxID=61207 RepID=A0A8A3PEB1_9HELO|nr:hypothetical protein DSL72_002979 [Monilinia vaccinii-corymbosi]